jgi:hypothetical protein
MKRNYEVGDVCWVQVSERKGLEKGTVVYWFINHVQGIKFFIIQLDDASHRELIVRDATLISPHADEALPLTGSHTISTVTTTGLL